MARLRFTADAQDDLVEITAYVARQSGSRALAVAFRRQLRQKCEKLASLPGIMGRERNELRDGLRSSAFKTYIIFYHYLGDELEVVNILEGHRDMGAFFGDDE